MSSILTVTTAADTYDLTTLATVKGELGISDADHNEDRQIARWIQQASGAIASNCNRVLAEEVVSEQFRIDRNGYSGSHGYYYDSPNAYDGYSSSIEVLNLSRFPVSAIASVTEDGTIVDVSDYEVEAGSGLLHRLSSDAPTWWCGSKIVVAYTAGYALLDSLPFPLERAAVSLVKQYRFAAKRDPLVKREQTDGVDVVDYWVGGMGSNGALPPDVIDLISSYRKCVLL